MGRLTRVEREAALIPEPAQFRALQPEIRANPDCAAHHQRAATSLGFLDDFCNI
jgi:hypothetical protein